MAGYVIADMLLKRCFLRACQFLPLSLTYLAAMLQWKISILMAVQSQKETYMESSVYKIIEIVGVSPTSWEEAAKVAVETAAEDPRRPAHRRGGETGRDHREGEGDRLSRPPYRLLQVSSVERVADVKPGRLSIRYSPSSALPRQLKLGLGGNDAVTGVALICGWGYGGRLKTI